MSSDLSEKIAFWLDTAYSVGWNDGVEGTPKRKEHNYELGAILDLIDQAVKGAEFNTKFDLMGLFYKVLADLYGEELASELTKRVGSVYTSLKSSELSQEEK